MRRDTNQETDERQTARAVLAANVRKLIDDAKETRPEIASILKVAEYSKKLSHGRSTLSKSRVGRIVKGEHATDVDALGDLADVFRLEPWQLLVEGLNPKALPSLTNVPVLTQIRALVAAQDRTPIVQTGEGDLPAVTPPKRFTQQSTRRQPTPGSSLDNAVKVTHKGGASGKRSTAEAVSKPRSDRNTAGNARTRRGRGD